MIGMEPPPIIAHRTCPYDAAENSVGGVREAQAQGADAVEIDLRRSLDGQLFALHDWTLWRTAGLPLPLEVLPSFIVRRLRLKGSDERVPTLAAILDALPAAMTLAIDVKTPWAVPRLLPEIRRRGLESRVLVWCTNRVAAAYMVRRAPAIETAYLSGARSEEGKLRFLAAAVALGVRAVSAHWDAIDATFVREAHEHGLKVYAWDQHNTLDGAKLTAGMDGLITDFPRKTRDAYAAL
jgi:glycerophosphoryl diester phosphodiesterase